jgi:hypothetical protein
MPAIEARGHRLVPSPVFVLSSIRSGSTLLRCILSTHSQLHAPHELHLADLRVQPAAITTRALGLLGFTATSMELDLWDSVLHCLLTASGKQHIVDKTPGNLLLWREIAHHWPQARLIFLTRHPAHILKSAIRSRPDAHPVEATPLVMTYLRQLCTAMAELPGLVVRYEDLTAHPDQVTTRICQFLGVAWEPQMRDYGRVDHGPLQFGIGDFGDKIRSGRVQPGPPHPPLATLSADLRAICADLGYQDAAA